MNKIKNILLLVFIVAYLIVILGFVNEEHDRIICSRIEICIRDSMDIHFIQKEDILSLLIENEDSLIGGNIKVINTNLLEEKLIQHPTIKTAEVFWTIDGVLRAEISQRLPIVRIIDQNQTSYFLDPDGYIVPVTGHYSPHVLVVNGCISQHYSKLKRITGKGRKDILKDVFEVSKYIYYDEFWRAQIEQLYVNEMNEMELIPRIGSHIIIMGEVDDYVSKLDRLKSLYVYGFHNTGWNQYERIDLKYKNQIICTKR